MPHWAAYLTAMKWVLRPIDEIGQYTDVNDMQVGGREGGGSGRSKPKIVAAVTVSFGLALGVLRTRIEDPLENIWWLGPIDTAPYRHRYLFIARKTSRFSNAMALAYHRDSVWRSHMESVLQHSILTTVPGMMNIKMHSIHD